MLKSPYIGSLIYAIQQQEAKHSIMDIFYSWKEEKKSQPDPISITVSGMNVVFGDMLCIMYVFVVALAILADAANRTGGSNSSRALWFSIDVLDSISQWPFVMHMLIHKL